MRSKREPSSYRRRKEWWGASCDTSYAGRFDGRALNFIGVDCGQGGVVDLARADADHPLDRLHEDFSVPHLTRAGRRENGLHARLDERLGADHFDFHFLMELHDECRAAILLELLVLTAMPADTAQRDAGDSRAEEGRLHLGQAVG